MIKQHIEERFWSKVDKTDGGCWNWKAYKSKQGYGKFKGGDCMEYAHRVSWLFYNGYLPNGMLVCHHCDNPSCVNPDHLFLGTHQDNMMDRDKKGRTRKKLTKEQAIEILYSSLKPMDLCKKFGVTHKAIRDIQRGVFWKSLNN